MTGDELDDDLESEEFYNLMQAYRHAPMVDQAGTATAYEDVKRFLRERLSTPLATAKEFIAEHVGVEPPLERDHTEHE